MYGMKGQLAMRRDDTAGAQQLAAAQAKIAPMITLAFGTSRTRRERDVVTAALVSEHLSEEGIAVVFRPLTQRVVLYVRHDNLLPRIQ